MGYAWTERQFVGGTVALDFANTVCYRADPARRFDKISEAAELAAFGEAASRLSDASLWPGRPAAACGPIGVALYKEIREFDGCAVQADRGGRAAGHGRLSRAAPRASGTARRRTAAGRRCRNRDRGGRAAELCRPADPVGPAAGCLARSAAAQNLPELPLALHRPLAQCQPALVRHAHLRKPRQGGTAPAAPSDNANQ